MSQDFLPVEDEDVIWLDDHTNIIMDMRIMLRKDEFEDLALYKITGIDSRYWNSDDPNIVSKVNWAKDGVDCDVLLLSTGKWMHGKVKARVILEFHPDEAVETTTPVQSSEDSPLDDIRQSIQ